MTRELLLQSGLRRVVIAGGDTSSYATQELGLYALEIRSELTPGAPLCRGYSNDPRFGGLEIALKGGQMEQGRLLRAGPRHLSVAAGPRGTIQTTSTISGAATAGRDAVVKRATDGWRAVSQVSRSAQARPAQGIAAGIDRAPSDGSPSLWFALLVIAEIVILFSGVVARYVLEAPLVWTDETASILFLWLAMLGAVVALRRNEHMRMTAVVGMVGPATRAFL